MNFKKMDFKKIKAAVLPILGLKADHKEKLVSSDEDKQKVVKATGKEGLYEKFLNAYNDEIDAIAENDASNEIFDAFMQQEADATGEELEAVKDKIDVDAKTASQKMKAVTDQATQLLAENKELKSNIKALEKTPEDDQPEAIVQIGKNTAVVKHSSTHLFSSNNDWDALDRPWNKNAAGNDLAASTTWNDVNIDKLNADLQDYSRRNSSEIMSMIFDGLEIPQHWSIVSNIQDEYVFAALASGELTQGYKTGFLPKNKQRFVPQKNKIYDKQIDGLFTSKQLKSIEKSWLNMFFNEGSTPYKTSFTRYLINELLLQARKEDKISLFKGVYKEIADDATEPGLFLNSMSGFLKIVSDKRGSEYLPHTLGKITTANIYDKVNEFVEGLPHDIRSRPGLKLGLSQYWHRRYHDARELRKGTNMDYTAQDAYVDKFPNITFTAHPQLDGTDFMYITPDNNIGIMIDRPGEDSTITLERDKRNINFFGDYKLGVYFKAFGAKVDATDAMTYENQIFFSNEADVLTDVYYPAESNDATPSVAGHYALSIGASNTAATNITNIDDAEVGDTVVLYGNSDTFNSTVVSNSNLILAGGANFVLANGSKIVLNALAGGKFVEQERSTSASAHSEQEFELLADATTADASNGFLIFTTSANTAATALTNITNAVDGQTYTIKGGDPTDTNPTSIASGGEFLLSAPFSATFGSYIKVKFNGSYLAEVARG